MEYFEADFLHSLLFDLKMSKVGFKGDRLGTRHKIQAFLRFP